MAEESTIKPQIGAVEWTDLTVVDAEYVKDFYCDVVGWASTDVSMGQYNDFNINLPDSNTTIAGICHARGTNSNLPPQWLVYVRVEDVTKSSEKCIELGGEVIDGPKKMGNGLFCVIKDPAGAVLALVSD